MQADITRDTFDASKHYTRVVRQQGRVQLDADSNEQTAILLHYLQSLAADLIGPHGGPENNLGFRIGVNEDGDDLTIGPGRYYVHGILCENESQETTYKNQPDFHPLDDIPDPPFLIYLDAWERHLTYLELEDMDGSVVSIRESALKGPDTATRAQVVWQVKITGVPDDYYNWEYPVDEKSVNDWISNWQQLNRGMLKARAIQTISAPDDPCITSPDSHYRGAANQLYRVEIHDASGSDNSGATFKWSRENGSVIFPVQSISGNYVTLYNLGRDTRFGLQPGDWVEIVDDDYTLQNQSKPLVQVDAITPDDFVVTLKNIPDSDVGSDPAKHPFLRRWDQRTDSGVLNVTESEDEWIDLEDGIHIQFQPDGTYYTGDYWLIPARTATGDVEWPGPKEDPEAQPPRGIEHHYAPLWIITGNGELSADNSGDLRRQFKQLWE